MLYIISETVVLKGKIHQSLKNLNHLFVQLVPKVPILPMFFLDREQMTKNANLALSPDITDSETKKQRFRILDAIHWHDRLCHSHTLC